MSEPALTADGAPHCIASEKSELPPEVDRASPFTVEIPGSDDVLANGIAWSAFDGCSGLTSVTMPEGVIHIGDHAFDGCSGLVSIVLPESVSRIRDCAFSECSGLTTIVLPEGLTHIGNEAFYECAGLESIVLPEGLTHLGQDAFYGCAGLTSVILPKGVSRIEDDAFSDCTWLVVVRLLSRDSIYVSSDAFVGCNHLSLVVAPRTSELVGTTFQGCPLLGGAGVVEDTAANRRRAVDLQYWGVRTHPLCLAPHRRWVLTVLLVANRLRGGALSLPREMWYTILESIRRWELGRVQCE
jgi:hypothetical protein